MNIQNKNRSTILQVDDTTRGIMEQVQSDLANTISDSLSSMRRTVEGTSDNTEMALRKLSRLDGLDDSLGSLRNGLKDLQQFVDSIALLQTCLGRIEENQGKINDELSQKIAELLSKLNQSVSDISHVIVDNQQILCKHIDDALEMLQQQGRSIDEYFERQSNDINAKFVNQNEGINAMFDEAKKEILRHQESATDTMTRVLKEMREADERRYHELEQRMQMQVAALNERFDKSQDALNIIVKQTTPFWKKLKKEQTE